MTASQYLVSLVDGVVGDQISIDNRGLAYGDGVFETMLLVGDRIPLLDYHMARLTRSCQVLGIPLVPQLIHDDLEQIKQQFYAAAEPGGSGRAMLKLMVIRGGGSRGYYPLGTEHSPISRILGVMPLPTTAEIPLDYTLQVAEQRLSRNAQLAGLKHLSRLEHVMAARSIAADVHIHGLLLDTEGFVIETVHHNVFVLRADRLITPCLRFSGVAGVMRQFILEYLAPKRAIPTEVKPLTLVELESSDEVFICNSVRGIEVVTQCGRRSWSSHPVTTCLQGALKDYWSRYAN